MQNYGLHFANDLYFANYDQIEKKMGTLSADYRNRNQIVCTISYLNYCFISLNHVDRPGRFATAVGVKILPICQIIDPILLNLLK
jgi:hypothetical protein